MGQVSCSRLLPRVIVDFVTPFVLQSAISQLTSPPRQKPNPQEVCTRLEMPVIHACRHRACVLRVWSLVCSYAVVEISTFKTICGNVTHTHTHILAIVPLLGRFHTEQQGKKRREETEGGQWRGSPHPPTPQQYVLNDADLCADFLISSVLLVVVV